MLCRLFYLKSLDRSISCIRGIWLVFILLSCYVEICELNVNSVDPDQMSDLGLHCLPMSLLWDARLKWVKEYLKHISLSLMLSTLGKIFSKWHFTIFFLFCFLPRNRIWHFMQIVSNGDNLHEVSNYVFLGKIRKILLIWRLLNLPIDCR